MSTFDIDGRTVNRLGYGTMQLPGDGVWGFAEDPENAKKVLRRAVELGVQLFDTADSYGPEVAEDLLREALHPYPDDLVIATKAGLTRQGPGRWTQLGFPPYLRQQCELSLRRLGVDTIDLYQLHRIDPAYPLEDQVGELKALQDEGKVRHIGLSEVDVDELRRAQEVATIVSVQNRFSLGTRNADELLAHCEKEDVAFIPWRPLADHVDGDDTISEIAEAHDASAAQIAIAWLLQLSPVMLPIPGTSSVEHLEQNTAAAAIELSSEEMKALSALGN